MITIAILKTNTLSFGEFLSLHNESKMRLFGGFHLSFFISYYLLHDNIGMIIIMELVNSSAIYLILLYKNNDVHCKTEWRF